MEEIIVNNIDAIPESILIPIASSVSISRVIIQWLFQKVPRKEITYNEGYNQND